LVVLACLVALAVAVATTPVGHEWAVDLQAWLGDVLDNARGRLS
jgi:hypothetical protein